MTAYFITATGTDIGKTFLTCSLASRYLESGHSVRAIKPVISGWDYVEGGENIGNDTVNILKSLSLPVTQATIQATSPWRLAAPLSPDMAAAREGVMLVFEEIVAFCAASSPHDYTLIEGAGGVMTPLTATHTIRDLIAALNIPAILVTGSYLGSLSHCLTAIEALKARNIPLAYVAVSETAGSTIGLQETIASLERFIDVPVMALHRRKEGG